MLLEIEPKKALLQLSQEAEGAEPTGVETLPGLTPAGAGGKFTDQHCCPKHHGEGTGAGNDNAAVTLGGSAPPSKRHLLTDGIFSFFSPLFCNWQIFLVVFLIKAACRFRSNIIFSY